MWEKKKRSLPPLYDTYHWDHSVHPYEYKTREEEREAILKSVAAIERAAGERPWGYMSPGPCPSPYTLEACASLGFKWNGDYCDSEGKLELLSVI